MRKTVRPKVVLCDLDGVVWLAHQPIPGSVRAIASLREAGIRVVFVTNNSFSTYDEQVAALASILMFAWPLLIATDSQNENLLAQAVSNSLPKNFRKLPNIYRPQTSL